MADNLDDLSEFLGSDDQVAIDPIMSRLSEITFPETYARLIEVAQKAIDLYSNLLESVAEREGFETIS